MPTVLLAALLALLPASLVTAEEPPAPAPKLLLSVKLLRRLKRDRERQTVRWVHFENRVKNVPDSPERGFELALYFAVTGDDARAKEALTWAAAHPCDRRQRWLIQDWVGGVATLPCPAPASLRDQAFERIATGGDAADLAIQARTQLIPNLTAKGVTNSRDLYDLVELLVVLRAASGQDIRNADGSFFRELPRQFLLSMKPDQVEHPSWITHVAALALVSVDPNLESSQFLQGWAMEDSQTLREGPGVAYELLWADPYLPGIAYQNLDPWVYDEEGARLFARSDWNSNACWISISKTGIQEVNCPKGWRDTQVQFGSLVMIPMTSKCLELTRQDARQNVLVWKLAPGQLLTYGEKKANTANADLSGMWHPGANIEGKVCLR